MSGKERQSSRHEKTQLKGEVIELFEEAGVSSIKIKFDELLFEIKTIERIEFHLGDRVSIEAILNIKTLEENFDHKT